MIYGFNMVKMTILLYFVSLCVCVDAHTHMCVCYTCKPVHVHLYASTHVDVYM